MLKFEAFFKGLLCISVILLLITGSIYHEIWRDEGHYIQIAKELSFFELISHSRVEGLIPTHPIILKILFFFFENKIIALKFLNIIIYLTIFFILIKSKTPFYIIVLFMLSYPIFYHGIINRYYISLAIPISYLILYENKKIIFKFLSFLLLSLSGIFGLFFLFSYLVSNLKKEIKEFLNNKLLYFIIIIISSFSFFYYTLPYEGRNWNNIQLGNSYEIFRSWYEFIYASVYIHNVFREFNIAAEISIPILYVNLLCAVSILLLYLTTLLLYLKEEKSLLILFFTTLIIYLLFFAITGHHSFRHYFVFSIILYLVNIKSLFLNKNRINIKKFNFFLKYKIYDYFLLLITLIGIILISTKFNEKITKFEVSNFYILLNYFLFLITAQNLFLKKQIKILILFSLIFLTYFIYFSIIEKNSYNSTLSILVITFLINFYLVFVSKNDYNFFNFKIIEKYEIQKKIIILILIISSIGSISYVNKEIKYSFSNSKNLSNYLNKNKINCADLSTYAAWEIGSWLPYFNDENCKINQLKTKKVSGFWDLNFWNDDDLYLDIANYDFTQKEYCIFVCESKDCREEEIIIVKMLNQLSIENKIILFNDKTLFAGGEKFLLLKVLN